jgi:hypothetical protein
MKTIKVFQGTVACRVASDDVVPSPAPPMQDVISAIQSRYQFAAPAEPFGVQFVPGQALSQYAFQSGKFEINGEAHAIAQLIMEPNGDVITSTSTDVANLIMDDLTHFLDETFKYKFRESSQKRSFVSTVIVQFDNRLEEKISALSAIIKIVNQAKNSKDEEFSLNKLAFSTGPRPPAVAMPFQSHLNIIEKAEYLIERRASAAFSENRYFCSAPLHTADHIKTLEDIEKILS